MGFTEAASDDGVVSGRGSPIKRGLASGVMTAVGGREKDPTGGATHYCTKNSRPAWSHGRKAIVIGNQKFYRIDD